jgi:hypothetical protein
VIRCELVAENLWLAIAWPDPAARVRGEATPPKDRWARDRAAAHRAEAAALAAAKDSGLKPHRCAVSRSHTLGAGAALVGPATRRLGVDLVALDRIGGRHARALLRREERNALASVGVAPPALAWALKEAAAKASGQPIRSFPDGLIIENDGHGLRVRIAELAAVLHADWVLIGDLLCAYTWE